MDHADQHGAEVVEQACRGLDHVEPDQQLVDHAVALEQDDPGERAHQETRPERQQNPEQQRRPRVPTRGRHEIRDGVARYDRDDGRQQRDPQRDQQDVDIDRRGEELPVLRQVEARCALDAEQQQLADRIDEQGGEQRHQRRAHRDPRPCSLPRGAPRRERGRAHLQVVGSAIATASAGRQSSETICPSS